MKKGVVSVLVLVLLSCLVLAQSAGIQSNQATLTITSTSPSSIYEFNTATINIRVENDLTSSNSINNIRLVSENGKFSFTSAKNPSNWTNTQNSSDIIWQHSGSGISDGGSQVFSFNISVPQLSSNDLGALELITTDTNDEVNVTSKNITLLNDDLTPGYSSLSHSNQTFVKNGTNDISVTVVEAESGFFQAELYYDYYTALSESTVTNSDLLNCVQSGSSFACSTQGDIQRPSVNKKYFGTFYNFSDLAGNQNLTPYQWLYVDDAAPSVNLGTDPVDNLITVQNTQDFNFSFDDNSLEAASVGFSPSIECSIIINGSSYGATTYDEADGNNKPQIINVPSGLGDGEYEWYASCTDSAEWVGTSVPRALTFDTTGPTITLNSPEDVSVIAEGTLINLTIEDAFSTIDNVWYDWEDEDGNTDQLDLAGPEYDISTDGWSYGENNITVHAEDSLGNDATASFTSFTFTIDNIGPEITLISPDNGAFGNAKYVFQADDDYSADLVCELIFSDIGSGGEVNTDSGQENGIVNTTEGSLGWYITCTDELGNSADSESWEVIVDLTVPTVTLTTPSEGENVAGTVWAYTYDQTDANEQSGPGGDGCTVHVYNLSSSDEISNDTSELESRNEPYSWNVSCIDLAGNTGTSGTVTFYNDDVVPQISGVASGSITASSAVISWISDEVANNTVFYGTNESELSSVQRGSTLTAAPSITTSSLSASTRYFFKVQSCDKFANCGNDSSTYNITTTASPSPDSPGGGGGGGGTGTNSACNDGADNDGDGLTDTSDPGCESDGDNSESNPAATASACSPLWRCTEWNTCIDGTQTRTCQDWNLCGTDEGKPEETQSCVVDGETVIPGTSGGPADGTAAGADGSETPLGVGQAAGIFGAVKSNWKPLTGALAVLSLMGLAFWQRSMLSTGFRKITSLRSERLLKEEEEIKEKLRQQGILK